MSKKIEYNEKIKASELHVIDEDGNDKGIMTREAAFKFAEAQDLGLVVVGANANPIVVKVCDVSKYLYQLDRKEKIKKKNTKNIQLKKISIRFCTDNNDFNTKMNMAKRFLNDGDRVMFVMFFRKREKTHIDKGHEMMNKVIEALANIAKPEKDPAYEGSTLSLSFLPVKKLV